MGETITRRGFLTDTATSVAGLTAAASLCRAATGPSAIEPGDFASQWHRTADRVWLGPEYWSNPLQDWRISGGRIECVRAAADRNVHLLTRQLGEDRGALRMSVRVGRIGGPLGQGPGSFGFRVGAQGPLRDYRNNLIFGTGLDAGVDTRRGLFLGSLARVMPTTIDLDRDVIELRLTAEPAGDRYHVVLSAHDPKTGAVLGEVRDERIASEQLVGNLVLVANFPGAGPGSGATPKAEAKAKTQAKTKAKAQQKGQAAAPAGTFWFADWNVGGSKVEAHDDRAFGPILFSQYTLHRQVLKLTAQMPPIGPRDTQTVQFQVRRGESWTTLAEEPIHPEARTATFRIESWDDQRDVPYRLAYTLKTSDGEARDHFWTGTARRDPVDQPIVTVADISCNAHFAFPNTGSVAEMAKLNPDVLAFTGDQYYESSGGYGVQRSPIDSAILDLLRKWYLHGWTWRDLMRDRPSVSIPDDHDVYQGNIWGEAGAGQDGTQEMGGYQMFPTWINVVHRIQTAHHPDFYDPTPIQRGISVYYGPMTYGRIGFAIIADRQFKSGPEGKVPPTGSRGDHVKDDPNYDPRTADLPGLQLLGDRQMAFLKDWAADWRGTDMKAVISQTIFTAMATTHGGGRERLRADYDTNGWPQSARNAALRELRKAFAFHIAGDQHLPAVIHYGVETHNDAAVAFAGPAVNNLYPRWWEPRSPGRNRPDGADETLGEFLDSFDNPLAVLAVANPLTSFRQGVLDAERDKSAGLGVVRFNKDRRTITVECWPFLADTSKPDTQFPGWPVTVTQFDNCGRRIAAHLPKLVITGIDNPVVQVVNEATGEVEYTLRVDGREFQPFVFADGRYRVVVSDPDSGRSKELNNLTARPNHTGTLDVTL
jgi:phosphodiesterase/alkaline phosphatase D-like protein